MGGNLYRYSRNPISWIDPWGWACWSTARKNYWKAEAKAPTRAYSPANLALMAKGKAPRMQVQVVSRSTDKITVKEYTLGFVRKVLSHAAYAAGQGDHGCKALGQLVIARADPAIFLEPAKHPLNDVPLTVFWPVKQPRQARSGFARHGAQWDYRLHPVTIAVLTQVFGIVSLVSQQLPATFTRSSRLASNSYSIQQRLSVGNITGLSW